MSNVISIDSRLSVIKKKLELEYKKKQEYEKLKQELDEIIQKAMGFMSIWISAIPNFV